MTVYYDEVVKAGRYYQPPIFGQNASPAWADDLIFFAPLTLQFVDAPFFTDADTFYGPTVSHGAAGGSTIQPSLFTDSDTFYAPSVSGGIATIQPALFTDSDTFYGFVIATGGDPIIIATARLDGEIKQ